ncbi:MAG TPA: IPT/TIG domain-containing protein [Candidatus Acidoferrales bacterium]
MHLRWTMFGMLASLVLFVSGCGGSGSGSNGGQPNATPVITGLAPASITAGSQTFTLFISGTGFINGSSGVTTAFWNGSPRTAIVNTNTNQIALAILPSDVAVPGLAQITASNPGPGGGLSQTAATFLITAVQPSAPLITSVSPTSASPAGAAFTLTVNGSNFMAPTNPAVPQLAGSIVEFNTSPHPTTFVSANQLTATISMSDIATAGCNTVTVYTPNGVGGFIFSPSISFAVSKSGAPLICAISPSSAVQNGPAFTLNVIGSNFASGSAVQFDGTAVPTTMISSSALQAQVPAMNLAKAGTFPVTVSNGSGSASPAVNFLVTAAAPTITSLSPSTSVAGGAGFALTVTGTNFTQDTVVEWDGSPRATKFTNLTTLTAQILAADIANAGTNSVVAVNPQGVGAASAPFPYIVTAAGAALAAKFPQVVSVSAFGGPADGPSESPAISADGRYVAFYSEAKNLLASGAEGSVFVRDTCAGVTIACTPNTKAIDVGADGGVANGKTGRQVAISGDGRFVSFMSRATNLVSGLPQAASGFWNVYVRDLCQGANVPSGCVAQTQLVSVAMNGEPSNGPSASPSLSGDGRFAAFVSSATNISAENNQARPQVFVRDTCAGPTATKSCVARTIAAMLDDDDLGTSIQSGRPMISADGRFVAFEAWSGSTAVQNPAESSAIVLADTCLGIDAGVGCSPSARRISYATDGSLLAGVNLGPSVTEDARFVVFESQPATTDGTSVNTSRVFLRDTCLGATAPDGCNPATTLVSSGNSSASDKNAVFSPFISASGRYISFVEGHSAFAAANKSAAEGALVVRDTCFGAALPCAARAYAFSAATSNPSKNAAVVVTGSGKIPSVSVDQFSAAPISADGRFAAFYAPGTVAAQPASGVGDVYISIALF